MQATQIEIKLMTNDYPGFWKRHLLQEVKESPELPVCVSVDGVCNHADTEYEEVALSHDPTETEQAKVCVGCGSIYDSRIEEWLK